jgi:hypothetical protein
MKISTDSTWCTIRETATGKTLFSEPRDPYTYEKIITAALSESQQARHIEHDGIFTLSKKREKAMLEEIAKHKSK